MDGESLSVRYTGSAEHKCAPSPAGPPALRSDASKCPTDVSFDEARAALETAIGRAIESGCRSKITTSRYPKLVWGTVVVGEPPRSVRFEARCTNGGNGEYHAYPVRGTDDVSDQLTRRIREILGWNA